MRLVTNESLIKRNSTIGRYASIAGLVILIGGLLVSFRPEPQYQFIPFVTLIVGFILSNVGIYFSNRYLKYRGDKALENNLKGFDDKYHLYNYRLPTPHFLIAPNGLFALIPKFQRGVVTWNGKRWSHKGGNFFLNLFGQEGLGNPTAEAVAEAQSASKFLVKKLGQGVPPVQAIVVFCNPETTIEAKDAPIPAMHIKQLKEYMRKLPKGPTLSSAQISQLNEALGVD
jgi:hypothetical protein